MEINKGRFLSRYIKPKIKWLQPTKCYVLTDPLVGMKGNIAKLLLMKYLGVRCKVYGWKDYIKRNKEKTEANESKRCINHTLSCLESVLEDREFDKSKYLVKFPIIVPNEGEVEADRIWNENGFIGKKVIIVSPGGVKPHKIWPVENYIEVIKTILYKDESVRIVLTGTVKDIELGDCIESEIQSNQIFNYIGKTTLPCLAAILKRADLLLGNDGGTMHLGDALGCVVVSIMPGLELPRTVEPWHNIYNAVRMPIECSPCYDFDNCPKRTYACMRRITVEDVLQKVLTASDRKREYNTVSVLVNRAQKIPVLKIDE